MSKYYQVLSWLALSPFLISVLQGCTMVGLAGGLRVDRVNAVSSEVDLTSKHVSISRGDWIEAVLKDGTVHKGLIVGLHPGYSIILLSEYPDGLIHPKSERITIRWDSLYKIEVLDLPVKGRVILGLMGILSDIGFVSLVLLAIISPHL